MESKAQKARAPRSDNKATGSTQGSTVASTATRGMGAGVPAYLAGGAPSAQTVDSQAVQQLEAPESDREVSGVQAMPEAPPAEAPDAKASDGEVSGVQKMPSAPEPEAQAGDAQAPVQAACGACVQQEAAESHDAVQMWDCHEHSAPTCSANVQQKAEGLDVSAEPPVQAACASCAGSAAPQMMVQAACDECEAEAEAEGAAPVQMWNCRDHSPPTCSVNVQSKAAAGQESPVQEQCSGCGGDSSTSEPDAATRRAARVQRAARRGVAFASQPLPHGDVIQRAFGRHGRDLRGIAPGSRAKPAVTWVRWHSRAAIASPFVMPPT